MSTEPRSLQPLVRPVACHYCQQPMFYDNDPRFEPEARIEVTVSGALGGRVEYRLFAHLKCWNNGNPRLLPELAPAPSTAWEKRNEKCNLCGHAWTWWLPEYLVGSEQFCPSCRGSRDDRGEWKPAAQPNTKFSRAADGSSHVTTTPTALAETPCSAVSEGGQP